MINHDIWRDQQLNSFSKISTAPILEQELAMLTYVKSISNIKWRWYGNNSSFKRVCESVVSLSDTDYQGVIVFGEILNGMSTSALIERIKQLIGDVEYAYVGINRYEVLYNDIAIELPETIVDSLDLVMKYCDSRFKRLRTFNEVDGNHMVAVHPMDCYILCK